MNHTKAKFFQLTVYNYKVFLSLLQEEVVEPEQSEKEVEPTKVTNLEPEEKKSEEKSVEPVEATNLEPEEKETKETTNIEEIENTKPEKETKIEEIESKEAANLEQELKETEQITKIEEEETKTEVEEPTTETGEVGTIIEVEETATQQTTTEAEEEKIDPIKEVVEVTETHTEKKEEISTKNLVNGIDQPTAEIQDLPTDQNTVESAEEPRTNGFTVAEEGLTSKSNENQAAAEESSTSKSNPVLTNLEVDLLLRNGEKEKECKNLQNSGKN